MQFIYNKIYDHNTYQKIDSPYKWRGQLHCIGLVRASLGEFDELIITSLGGNSLTRSRACGGLLRSESNEVAKLVVVQAVVNNLEEHSPRNQHTEHSPGVSVAIVEYGVKNIVAAELHAHAREGLGVVHLVHIAVERVLLI